jgi:hypothetical protein
MGSQLVRIHRSIEVIPRVQPLIVLRCCGSKPLRKASWQPSPPEDVAMSFMAADLQFSNTKSYHGRLSNDSTQIIQSVKIHS